MDGNPAARHAHPAPFLAHLLQRKILLLPAQARGGFFEARAGRVDPLRPLVFVGAAFSGGRAAQFRGVGDEQIWPACWPSPPPSRQRRRSARPRPPCWSASSLPAPSARGISAPSATSFHRPSGFRSKATPKPSPCAPPRRRAACSRSRRCAQSKPGSRFIRHSPPALSRGASRVSSRPNGAPRCGSSRRTNWRTTCAAIHPRPILLGYDKKGEKPLTAYAAAHGYLRQPRSRDETALWRRPPLP